MKQKILSNRLKVMIAAVGLLASIAYVFILPAAASYCADAYPEFCEWKIPWLVYISLTAIPIAAAAILAWRIAANIGHDKSFTRSTSQMLSKIAKLAAAEAAYIVLGGIVLIVMNMSHPGIVLCSGIPVILCIAVSVAAAMLSHLAEKAAYMREEQELTI